MPACHNCGNTERFVLLVVCATTVAGPDDFSDPEWSLSLECGACASTDVAGDPAVLLARHGSA